MFFFSLDQAGAERFYDLMVGGFFFLVAESGVEAIPLKTHLLRRFLPGWVFFSFAESDKVVLCLADRRNAVRFYLSLRLGANVCSCVEVLLFSLLSPIVPFICT